MANIHQEVTFASTPAKVYRALVDAAEFGKVTGAPTAGAGTEGSTFSAFGGAILGRNIELVADTRIVQAWRVKVWPEGTYSLVRFELRAEGGKTRLVLDHDALPADMKEHLEKGWHTNYWEPLAKHFGA